MEKVKLTRKELYDMVWIQPIKEIAKSYSIPYKDLRKVCSKMKVPIPGSGYWLKKKKDKWVIRRVLTSNYFDKDTVTLTLEGVEHFISLETSLSILEREIKKNTDLHLTIPTKLVNPSPVILKAQKAFQAQMNNKWGRRSDKIGIGNNQLDIRVNYNSVPRALLFMDTLIKLLKTRGHDILVDGSRSFIKVYNEKIYFSLRELSKKITVEDQYFSPSSELKATGKLCFKVEMYHSMQWTDGLVLIDERLSNILAKLELLGKTLHHQTIRHDRMRKKEEELELIKKKYMEKVEEEKNDVKALFKEANRWHHAQTLRSYIDCFEEKAVANKTLSEDMEEYIKWVNRKIDWYDPMIDGADDYLDGEFKEELQMPTKEENQSTQQHGHYWGKSHWESHW